MSRRQRSARRIGRVRPLVALVVGACRTRRRRAAHRDRPGSSGRRAAPAAPRPARQPATSSDADRQPYCSESQAISGRNTSWPAAPPAVSTPITRPRRRTNQRLAMVAAKTSAIDPVPSPISTPQVSTSCQPAVTKTVSPLPSATSTSARAGHLPDAEPIHQRGGERRGQAVQDQVDPDRDRQQPAGPAELVLHRDHQDARAPSGIRPLRSARSSATPATIQAGCMRWRLRSDRRTRRRVSTEQRRVRPWRTGGGASGVVTNSLPSVALPSISLPDVTALDALLRRIGAGVGG